MSALIIGVAASCVGTVAFLAGRYLRYRGRGGTRRLEIALLRRTAVACHARLRAGDELTHSDLVEIYRWQCLAAGERAGRLTDPEAHEVVRLVARMAGEAGGTADEPVQVLLDDLRRSLPRGDAGAGHGRSSPPSPGPFVMLLLMGMLASVIAGEQPGAWAKFGTIACLVLFAVGYSASAVRYLVRGLRRARAYGEGEGGD